MSEEEKAAQKARGTYMSRPSDPMTHRGSVTQSFTLCIFLLIDRQVVCFYRCPTLCVRMPLTHSLLVDRQVGMSGYSHITVWYLLTLLVNRQDLFTYVVILIISAWYLLLASLVDRQDLFTRMDTLIIATWYLLLASLVDLVGSFHVYGYSYYFCMVSSSHIVG